MFVVGIKIFFGFVCGALILGLCLTIAALLFLGAKTTFSALYRGSRALAQWVERRGAWIGGVTLYFGIAVTLYNCSDARWLALGFGMFAVLLIAGLVKVVLLADRRIKRRLVRLN